MTEFLMTTALSSVAREQEVQSAHRAVLNDIRGLAQITPDQEGPLAAAVAGREFEHLANLRRVEELRERLRLRREWDADKKKHRSPRFLAEVLQIRQEGGSVWRA
ncbi:MAG: hypothetical protein EBR86_13775, partial [Planctomycetia bacterium]|nr:hypothetical protein [Planctomycetia bacterium]